MIIKFAVSFAAFSSLFLSSSAFAAADLRACIDDQGGTYVVSINGSISCENSGCALPSSTRVEQLKSGHTILSPAVTAAENAMATTLNALMGQKEFSSPMLGEPQFFRVQSGTKLFCSSWFSQDDFDSQNVHQALSQDLRSGGGQ